jgi:hypothetical protein
MSSARSVSRRASRYGEDVNLTVVKISARDPHSRKSTRYNLPLPQDLDAPKKHKTLDELHPDLSDDDDSEHKPKKQVELYDEDALQRKHSNLQRQNSRLSCLSGWSMAALSGDIIEEMDHAFGHVVGTTGCANAGKVLKGTQVWQDATKFWTPGQHDSDEAGSDDGWNY